MAVLAGDDLRDHHALVLALVREHRAAYHVADRVDPRQRGPAVLVHLDEALSSSFRPTFSAPRSSVFGTRPTETMSRSHSRVYLTYRRRILNVNAFLRLTHLGNLTPELDIEPLSLVKIFQASVATVSSAAPRNVGQRLQHLDLRAQAPPHAAELQADHAGPDDAQSLGDRVEGERAFVVADELVVDGTPAGAAPWSRSR